MKTTNTTIGIKEFIIYSVVPQDEAIEILKDLEKGESRISKLEGVKLSDKNFTADSETYEVSYDGKLTKISFTIYFPENKNIQNPYAYYSFDARIHSPSPISLMKNSIKDIENIIAEYDKFVSSLSKLMPLFSDCRLDNLIYGFNYDLNELEQGHISDNIWSLVKRGIPSSKYFSSKYAPLCDYPSSKLESNEKNAKFASGNVYVKHYRDRRNSIIDPVHNGGKHSTNVISFGIDIDATNAYCDMFLNHSAEMELNDASYLSIIKCLLSDKTTKIMLKDYFDGTIMGGNYFKLPLAIETVLNSDFSQEKKEDMVDALKLIHEGGDIYKTKLFMVKNHVVFPHFNDVVKNLVSIGVNPITVPPKCGVDFIQGLLETCESLVYDNTLPVAKP